MMKGQYRIEKCKVQSAKFKVQSAKCNELLATIVGPYARVFKTNEDALELSTRYIITPHESKLF